VNVKSKVSNVKGKVSNVKGKVSNVKGKVSTVPRVQPLYEGVAKGKGKVVPVL
jgi:chemotaxis signal transduction protein